MEKKLQKNYEELKEKSELTEKRIRFIDQIDLDYKSVPPTKKGLEREVKKLMKKLEKENKNKK